MKQNSQAMDRAARKGSAIKRTTKRSSRINAGRAVDSLREMKRTITPRIAAARQTIAKRAKEAEAYAKRNPRKAAAIAAGVGAVVGAAAGYMLAKRGGKK